MVLKERKKKKRRKVQLNVKCCMSGPVAGIFIKRMQKACRASVLNVMIYISFLD